ncbi:hypothetical protein B0H14DRAFT_3514003 [Mycena olivaceomarginata]|nr:hypothetical protein B0H14DRAFT_3514003 [Mycena olivaceomarginata]
MSSTDHPPCSLPTCRVSQCPRLRLPAVTATSNALAAPGPLPPPLPGGGKRSKGSRRKSGDPPGKRGPSSWVWGTKLRFFESRKDNYETQSEKKVAGSFYTKMSKLYIVKFAGDVADPPDWVANKVVNEKLTPEEEKFRQEFYTKLRDRLGQWYHIQYASLLKEDKATFSELHQVARRGSKAPHAITVQNEVTKECWEEETYAYQQEMVREREREHNIRVKAWKESMGGWPE